jgi:hypothetical protein
LRDSNSVWHELSFLWSLNDWNIAIQIFRLFKRLAKNCPREVASFLDTTNRLETKMARERKQHLLWEILRVAEIVGCAEPIWLFSVIKWMHKKQKKQTGTTDFLANLVRLACAYVACLPLEEFNKLFKKSAIEQAAGQSGQISTKVAAVYGLAWSKIWQIQKATSEDIIEELGGLSLLHLKPGLFGLSDWLCSIGNIQDAERAVSTFDAMEDKARKHFWLLSFWPGVVRQFSVTRSAVGRRLLEDASSRLARATSNSDVESKDFIRWVSEIDWRERFKDQYAKEAVSVLFQTPIFQDPSSWLMSGPLRSCLGLAALAGIPSARALLEEIASGSRIVDQTEFNSTVVKITNQLEHDPWARRILFRLGLAWRDYEAIADAVERLIEAGETQAVTNEEKEQIVLLTKRPLPKGSNQKELGVLRLRTYAAIEGWQNWPTWSQLTGELAETSNEERFRLLLHCVEEGVAKKMYNPSELLSSTDRGLRTLHARLATDWENTLVKCLAGADKLSPNEIERTFRFMLAPGMGMDRLKLFSNLLTKAVRVDVRNAFSMLEEFLFCPSAKGLGRSANFTLSHRLLSPVSVMIKEGGSFNRKLLVALLPKISPIIAASFVHLLCGAPHTGLLDELDRIYRTEDLDEFVRVTALKKRLQRQGATETKRYEFLSLALARGST